MRDFAQEHKKLMRDLHNEIVESYVELKLMGLERPLSFHGEPLNNQFEIPIKMETKLVDGWATKISSVVVTGKRVPTNMSLKGFQIGRKKYRIKPIKDLPVNLQQEILVKLKEIKWRV